MRLIALAAFALGACSAEPERGEEQLTTLPASDGVDDPASAPPPLPLSPIETLAGEWRVAGIDGEPFDEPYGLALSADEEEIWWEPSCAGMIRSYTIEGMRISVDESLYMASRDPDAPPPAVCTIPRHPRLEEVARALDNAERVGRAPSNGILLEGGGYSVTLYSQ